MNKHLRIVWGLALLALASCKVGQQHRLPPSDMPQAFVQADSGQWVDLQWRQRYTDSTLQQLIQYALDSNQNLRIAALRVQQSMQQRRIATAPLFPYLSVGGAGEREVETTTSGTRAKSTEFELLGQLRWEVDLWGKNRWGRDLATAQWQATEEERRGVQISLVAEVAQRYFELMALYNEVDIVQQTRDARKEAVRIAKLRFEGGLTAETALKQAVVELAKTEALLPDLERRLGQQRNQLAALLGRYQLPADLAIGQLHKQPLLADLPAGLPSELLLRRPDVCQAERDLAAANARVGIAKAQMFPSLTLTADLGMLSDPFSKLLSSPYNLLAGGILGPVFQGGRLKASHRAAKLGWEQTVLSYERTLIGAFQEVENAFLAQHKSRESTQAQRNLLQASQEYMRLAQLQYINGVIGYIDVLDAQRRLLDAEIGLNQAIRNELLAGVLVYRALGGGWQ